LTAKHELAYPGSAGQYNMLDASHEILKGDFRLLCHDTCIKSVRSRGAGGIHSLLWDRFIYGETCELGIYSLDECWVVDVLGFCFLKHLTQNLEVFRVDIQRKEVEDPTKLRFSDKSGVSTTLLKEKKRACKIGIAEIYWWIHDF
jgi:hypothetical protein